MRSGRVPLVLVLAVTGGAIAAYLAVFELGVVSAVWDPLFGDGSETVLRWPPTAALPVPDAVLGLIGYGAEVVLLVGARLAARPVSGWLTVALGVLATVMAVTSIGLVAAQAFGVHAWCTLCLVSAAMSCVIALIAI